MILDALLEFDSYAGVAITVTRDSTNILDMLNQRDMGVGEENVLDLLIKITVAFTAGGAATLVTEIQGAIDNAGVPGAWVSLAQTAALPVAALTAGREILRAPLPMWNTIGADQDLNMPRFYKLVYTVATGPMLTGKVASYLIGKAGRDANRAYPPGFGTTYI